MSVRQIVSTLSLVACVLFAVAHAHAQEAADVESPGSFEVFAPAAPPALPTAAPAQVDAPAPAPAPVVAPTSSPAPARQPALTAAPGVPAAREPSHPQPAATAAASAREHTPTTPPASAEAEPSAHLRSVDARLSEVQRELDERPLGGPRLLTVVGFVGAHALFFAGVIAGLNEAFDYEEEDAHGGSKALPLFLLSGASLVAGVGGVVWLARTRRARRPYVREDRELRQERATLITPVPALGPSSLGLSLQGRF